MMMGDAPEVQINLPGHAYSGKPTAAMRTDASGQRLPETALTGIVRYFTPARYVEAARAVMGGIDLDPASCAEANVIVRAAVYYDEVADGLSRPWFGRVFLNPPWSGLAARFVRALLASYRAGAVTQAILVLNASYTDRSYMRPVLRAFPFCLTDHRVRYGGAGQAGTGGTMFVYLGPLVQTFVDAFSTFGPVVRRMPTTIEEATTANEERE